MRTVKVDLSDKPLLQNLMKESPAQAREVFDTFLSLLELSLQNGWNELPQKMVANNELSFKELIHGILHGALDLPKIAPETYSFLGAQIHPLSLLGQKKVSIMGEEELVGWREYFKLPSDTEINQETVAKIIRTLMQYGRWIDFKSYYDALAVNDLTVWKQNEQPQAALLAIQPALKRQIEVKGELAAGDFLEDTGYFNCGIVEQNVKRCPACKTSELIQFNEDIKVCEKCNAGFKI